MNGDPSTFPGLPLPHRLARDVSVLGSCCFQFSPPSNSTILKFCSVQRTRAELDSHNDGGGVQDVRAHSSVLLPLFWLTYAVAFTLGWVSIRGRLPSLLLRPAGGCVVVRPFGRGIGRRYGSRIERGAARWVRSPRCSPGDRGRGDRRSDYLRRSRYCPGSAHCGEYQNFRRVDARAHQFHCLNRVAMFTSNLLAFLHPTRTWALALPM